MSEKALTETDDGRTIALGVGDTLVLRLAENPTTGFRWRLHAASDDVLDFKSTHFDAPDSSPRGAGGARLWTFQAKKNGTTSVQLELVREWQSDDSNAKRFAIQVQVH